MSVFHGIEWLLVKKNDVLGILVCEVAYGAYASERTLDDALVRDKKVVFDSVVCVSSVRGRPIAGLLVPVRRYNPQE